MRSKDVDILLVPGLGGSGPDHWQSRWEAKLTTARRVEQDDWDAPDLAAWSDRLADAIARTTRPIVIVAHSLGTHVVAHASPAFPESVVGTFLVAPPDLDDTAAMPECLAGMRVPRATLPCTSLVVASRTDPWCSYPRAEAIAALWGAPLVDAGDSGHINTQSGHGPWPEGLMRFAGFLKALG